MTSLPREPTGNSPLVQTIRLIIRCLREREIIAGKGVKVSKTGQGTVIDSTGASGGGGGQTTSNVPRWG